MVIVWCLVPAAASAETVTLGWDPSDGATGYRVSWGTAAGSYPNVADAGNATTFALNGLAAGGTYWAVVQAYNGAGSSPYSTPLRFTVPGLTCTFSISPGVVSAPSAGTSGSITISTPPGCAWSATSTSGALTFHNGTGRTGPGSVLFTVAAHSGTTARTVAGVVAGKTFSVTQAAVQACSYAISPGSLNAPTSGAAGAITVTTGPGCAWSASSAQSFLTFTDGANRSGPGTVSYIVTANTTASRTASATVAGKPFTVSQSGANCTYSVSPVNISRGAAASTGTVTVTTQAGCGWTAGTGSTFLAFADGSSRSGTGTVTFTLAENLEPAGRNAAATVAGVTVTVAQAGTASGTSGPLRWSSDFDGDGRNDILVQDATTGAVEAWFLDGAAVKGMQALSDTPGGGWRLAGRGDFNADGKPDLVWQHRVDGQVSLWYMDGTMRLDADAPAGGQAPDPAWKVVGVADFNADQRPDLVWQHEPTGALSVWLMNGSTVFADVPVVPDRTADLQWKVVGAGDFNIDGKPDLLWRHMGSGDVAVWLMNGLSRIIHAPLSPRSLPDQGWQVGAVADLNADNRTDIVWHHTDGSIMIWHMSLTSRVSAPVLALPLPAGWVLAGPR